MQADVILKEPPSWVPPLSLSGGGASVEGGGGRGPLSYAPASLYKAGLDPSPFSDYSTLISDKDK